MSQAMGPLVRRYHDRQAEQRGYCLAAPGNHPAHILEKIVWQKELELEQWVCQGTRTTTPPRNFRECLAQVSQPPALIAEVKKASPSRGVLRADFDAAAIAVDYVAGGAACLSVLTDEVFFQGSFTNLSVVRRAVDVPLLCKEFVIHVCQIDRAREYGADAVLLIVAILSNTDLVKLLSHIGQLGMQALVEVHSIHELERLLGIPEVLVAIKNQKVLIGVNNRNLTDFTVNLQTTITVIESVAAPLRQEIFWVSESGLFTRSDLDFVAQCGARAVLIGESLVKQANIAAAVSQLLTSHG